MDKLKIVNSQLEELYSKLKIGNINKDEVLIMINLEKLRATLIPEKQEYLKRRIDYLNNQKENLNNKIYIILSTNGWNAEDSDIFNLEEEKKLIENNISETRIELSKLINYISGDYNG